MPLFDVLTLDTKVLFHINLLIGCFFFSFTGSYIQELLAVYNGIQRTTKIHKLIVGTLIGGVLFFYLSDKYFKDLNVIVTTVANIACGAFGYEVFNRTSSLESLKKTSELIREIIGNLFAIDNLFRKKEKEEDKNKDE